jgi:putative membrane protein
MTAAGRAPAGPETNDGLHDGEMSDHALRILFAAVIVAMAISAIDVQDGYGTWFLEVIPILVGLPLLYFTRHTLRFSPFVYYLIAAHCLVLMVGAHWSYEKVPLGEWLNHALGWKRNDYDRLGHFFQGLVPTLIAREVLIRKAEIRSKLFVALLALCVAMAFSAVYELIEMFLSLAGGGAAARAVDSQGDVWDPEWDMFFCLLGSLTSLAFLARFQDRQLARIGADEDR